MYYAGVRADKESENLLNKISRLMKEAGLDAVFGRDDLVALKTHFGEPGNTAFLRPQYMERVVEVVRGGEGKPFLTDSNTLYTGARSNAVDHLHTAVRHGFTYPVVDAPVVIADGLTGREETMVSVPGRHFERVRIGSAVHHSHSLIGVAHFKGHLLTGFGGAIKNIGMGVGSVKGKLEMHMDVRPSVKEEECQSCGLCAEYCPAGAISVDGIARIDHHLCIGCGECYVTCPHDAISPGDDSEKEVVQEKIVEYTLGALKGKMDRCGFINIVLDVTPQCDCPPWNDSPVVPDVGIVASRDIVAIDQACADLVNRQPGLAETELEDSRGPGEDKFRALHDVNWEVQLEYGEEIALGERDYRLVEVN
ncbi:MAG: DUF362 domain-containing protein [Thermoplasmatota archaeon]